MITEQPQAKPLDPVAIVERIEHLTPGDLSDLCDATDAAIVGGGGFGWVKLPARDILERYWSGVVTMPTRQLFVARLDGVICGTAQMILPARNNEAQSFAVSMTSFFVAPWARGHGLARMLVEKIEQTAHEDGFGVIHIDVRETQDAAISLYERMGYTLFGVNPVYSRVDGKIIPGRYYYKILDPAIQPQDGLRAI